MNLAKKTFYYIDIQGSVCYTIIYKKVVCINKYLSKLKNSVILMDIIGGAAI
jgi:hypothetical protein